jgi:structural maintenance of chromosome 2
MKLLSVSVKNFKSFSGKEVVVPFDAGFNCVTGPNGSGKSNVLDAICFCLGESNTRLRVSRTAELLTNIGGIQRQTDAVVELTLRDDRGALIVIKAKADLQGAKSYAKNGRATTLKDVRRMLLCECNLAVDSPSWLMYQGLDAIRKDGAFLVDALCAASGTKLFHNFKTEADRKMAKFAVNQEEVRANVDSLRARIQKELLHFEEVNKLKQVEKTIAQMEHTEKKMVVRNIHAELKSLEAETGAANSKEQQIKQKLKEQLGKCAEAKSAISALASGDLQELAAREKALSKAQERLSTSEMEQELEVAEATEAAAKCAETEQSLRSKRTELHTTKALISRVEGHVIPALVADINETKMQQERVAKETDSAALLRDVSTTLHTMELMLANESTKATQARSSKAHAASETKAMMSRKARVETQLELFKSKQLQLREGGDGRDTSSFEHLEKQLDAAQKQDQRIQRAAKERMSKLARFYHKPGQALSGYYGTLFSCIRIRAEAADGECEKYMDGLEIILGGRLSVRVCDSNHTAKALVREASKGGGRAMTLWALDRVVGTNTAFKPSTGQKVLARLRQKFGEAAIVDPHSLLCIGESESKKEPRLEAVLYKAVGSWLLTESDEVAKALLDEYRIPSVCWTTGNQHIKGALIGGHRASKGSASSSPLRLKHQEATDAAQFRVADQTRRRCEAQIRRLEELSTVGTKVRQSESQLELLCSQAEECRGKLEHVTIEEEHTRYALQCCEEKVDRARAQKRTLEQQQEGGGTHTDQLLAELKQLLGKYRQEVRAKQQEVESARDQATLCTMEMAELEESLRELPAHLAITATSRPSTNEERQKQRQQEQCAYKCECEELQREVQQLRAADEANEQQALELEEQVLQQESTAAELKQALTEVQRKLKRLSTACASTRSAANEAASEAAAAIDNDTGMEEDAMDLGEDDATVDIAQALLELQCQQREATRELAVLKETTNSRLQGPVCKSTFMQKKQELGIFESQLAGVATAIHQLQMGLEESKQRMQRANEDAYRQIRRHFREIFSQLVPLKQADLCKSGTEVEQGLHFLIRNRTDNEVLPGDDQDLDEGNAGVREGWGPWKTGLDELSGGQKALLGLSFTFAIARFAASPLYILDEIDAALDEYNQGVVAKLVATYFKRSQVICISHHPAFHREAGHVIQIDKDPKTNSSALQKIISRRPAAS